MAEEAWLSGKLEGFLDVMMPAAHALVQSITDLRKFADLTKDELLRKPNNAPSVSFHLRHIAGSCDRLLTYAKDESLTESQFEFLRNETAEESSQSAKELVDQAILKIDEVLDFCKNVSSEILFEERFVGRKKLQTNVFGLLFHIAEHTARHVGQVVTTVKIVKK